MRVDEYLGEAATLREWLERLGQFPGDGWLVVARGVVSLSLETPCRPVKSAGRDLSDDEHDELDALLDREGWKYFLSERQLEDVLANLRPQRPSAPSAGVLEAIEHYWSTGCVPGAGRCLA
jgi:hypothetical protein